MKSRGRRVGEKISWLISAVAPPLHSLHWKIFALCLAAIFAPGLYFAWKVGQGIERSHLRSTEQGMIDTGLIVAEMRPQYPSATLPITREILRNIFKDFDPNLRIVTYDSAGRVQQDSDGEWPVGVDHSQDRDVRLALNGEYGSRWQRDSYRRAVVLFVSVPVIHKGSVEGVVRVIKSTGDVRRSVIRSLIDLAAPAALALFLATAASYALSTYLTRIIADLAQKAEAVARGEAGVRLETWSKSELGDLARTVEKMRLKLEGKAYVENMVATLSHEIKTPLAAIRGAAEITENSRDPDVRSKFLTNIRSEVDRLAAIVNNLLALSRYETQPMESDTTADVSAVARRVATSAANRAETLGVTFTSTIPVEPIPANIPADSLERLIEILVDNALQFTPSGKSVRLSVEGHEIRLIDEGPGIPPALLSRVFERFFTTVNPINGRRGTGLGLAIAKSIADRHGATITLENANPRGTAATVRFRT